MGGPEDLEVVDRREGRRVAALEGVPGRCGRPADNNPARFVSGGRCQQTNAATLMAAVRLESVCVVQSFV